MVFVTDDFPGVEELIGKLFPFADHQLCLLHLQRNLRRNLSDEAYREAAKLLRKIKGADDKEEEERLFVLLLRGGG